MIRLSRWAIMLGYLAAGLASSPAIAASCYDHPAVAPLRTLAPHSEAREVLVIIDQTVGFPGDVRQQVINIVDGLAQPGTLLVLGSFSTYSPQTFARPFSSFLFEAGIPADQVRQVNRRARDALGQCLGQMRDRGRRQLRTALDQQFHAARPSIGQSDIMNSIQQFGNHIRAARTRDRIMIIVSDMLENSSVTTFYANRALRRIDPQAELRKAETSRLFAQLGGARVYVIGMGAFSGQQGAAPRNIDAMQRLERFWAAYLRRSGASLVVIGQPLLLQAVH